MFPTLPPLALPLRLGITAIIPVGISKPTQIVLTCDPPSDRFAVVWYQDTMTDTFTPAEALDAIYEMVRQCLDTLETGQLFTNQERLLDEQGDALSMEMPGQSSLWQ